PVRSVVVAPGTLTTAGTPYSRATTAACDSGPPSSVTTAAATRNSGDRPTSVVRLTRISPGPTASSPTAPGSSTRARPSTTPPLAGRPTRRPPGAGGSC